MVSSKLHMFLICFIFSIYFHGYGLLCHIFVSFSKILYCCRFCLRHCDFRILSMYKSRKQYLVWFCAVLLSIQNIKSSVPLSYFIAASIESTMFCALLRTTGSFHFTQWLKRLGSTRQMFHWKLLNNLEKTRHRFWHFVSP